ncbi:MAG: BatD family protein [Spirochaetales bacterium]|nr:BatD family protein [Spirochaetales bacterium]
MKRCRNCFIVILLYAVCTAAFTQSDRQIRVEAAVEKTRVFTGESFVYQIQVQGSDKVEAPDVSAFTDFDVTFLGGDSRNTTMISQDLNTGKVIQNIKYGYVCQYRLTPKRAGTLIIPEVMVTVAGKNYMTRAIQITVSEPEEVGDYKFRINLSKNKCYVGEQVKMTFTWYFSQNVRNVEFNISFLSDSRMSFETAVEKKDPNAKYYTIPVGNKQVEAMYGSGSLGGKSYNILTFSEILIPGSIGTINFPKATVSFEGVSGYRKVRDFFMGEVNQPVYSRYVIPSNAAALSVRDVPSAGRPFTYSGLVGRYTVSAAAAPLEVSVGDPVTLTLTLKGPAYLKDADIPDLNKITSLTKDFKIPSEMASGKITGNTKVFTQTIRALHDEVKQIPVIEIPYFNTASGKYEFARTQAIPLKVNPARDKVTIMDLKGEAAPSEMGREVEVWKEGIAHNYEDMDVIINRPLGAAVIAANPALIVVSLLLMLGYVALVVIFKFKLFGLAGGSAVSSKKYHSGLLKVLKSVPDSKQTTEEICGAILEKLRQYLGSKLNLNWQSIVFKDVEGALMEHALDEDLVKKIGLLFKDCESVHYAPGLFKRSDVDELALNAIGTINLVERNFK